jgi:hypothetical protein
MPKTTKRAGMAGQNRKRVQAGMETERLPRREAPKAGEGSHENLPA